MDETLLETRGGQSQRHSIAYAAGDSNPYADAAPSSPSKKLPKDYITLGRLDYLSFKQGTVLHPFGQDDWISRWYIVVWSVLSLVVTFLILVDPEFFGLQDSLFTSATTLSNAALFIGVLLNVILTINRPSRARVTTVAATFVVFSWSLGLYLDAAVVLHQSDSTYSRVKKSFAVVIAALLIAGDTSFLVLLGRVLSLDKAFGWWPLSDPFSDQLRRRQKRYVTNLVTPEKGTKRTERGNKRDAKGTSQPREDTEWGARTLCEKFVKYFAEDGAFTYPPSVLIAAFLTPVLLIWLFALTVQFSLRGAEALRNAVDYSDSVERDAATAAAIVAMLNTTCVNPQCWENLASIQRVIDSSRTTASNVKFVVANLPSVVGHAGLAAAGLSFIFALYMVARNVADFKCWVKLIWARKTVEGRNVTTNRENHDIARSAEYVAVFASTHLLALLSLFYTLGLVFVLLGYSRTSAFIASRRDYILAYIVVYLIVVYVGNKVLSDGQRPRRPRPLSYFLNCLCVYYIGSAVFAAVTRIVIAQSFFFTRFCMLHSSPFTPWWQQNDYPFRAAQSLLAYHTRTQNSVFLGFAETLHMATQPHREAAAAAAAEAAEAGFPPPPERAAEPARPEQLARNRWFLAYTLIRNPEIRGDRHDATEIAPYSLLEQRAVGPT